MSQLDEELKTLRLKLAALEEQKRIEAEIAAEQRANPLKTLETFLTQTRATIERDRYSKSFPLAGFYDRRTVAYLEPIVEMLKRIEDRLDALEAK
jgi:hypothetical protein